MPTSSEHLNWAQQNESLVSIFELTDAFEVTWAITVVFYAAVHYVDAYLVKFKYNKPIDHAQRDSMIIKDDHLTTIWRDYKRLKDLSRAARYECADFRSQDLVGAKKRLSPVREPIASRLKIELGSTPS